MVQERSVTLDIEPEDEPTTDDEIFYNTEMVRNRDISVACLEAVQDRIGDGLVLCDALSASGIRGMRYVNEVSNVEKAFLNDMDPSAVENIRENLAENGLADDDRIEVTNYDANRLLTDNYRQLDFVDIDPFGSPGPYLDSTMRSLFREACIGITATDLAPLFGSYPEVCERRYGSTPLKNAFSHETGLRILIKNVFEAGSRYDFAFQPLFCHYERHYYRIFGTVRESKQTCNQLREHIGYLAYCGECLWRSFYDLQDLPSACPHCGERIRRAGPLWTGRFADRSFVENVQNILAERGYEDAAGLTETVHNECDIITPHYDTHQLGSATGSEAPRKQELIAALQEHGYRANETHFLPQGVRTDAPIETLHELAQE